MTTDPRSPLDALGTLAVQDVEIAEGFRHVEVYTLEGLLTILWHGPRDARDVVLACGGGMGGLLGPADGLYHDLGVQLGEAGVGVLRVDYRQPNHLPRCVHDLVAAGDLASRGGARRFVAVGHSFGGAVAIQAGLVLGEHCRGVITLATQSAGCEDAGALAAPLLLLHGTNDEILPPETSGVVQMLAGGGEVVLLPGAGHLLREASDDLRARLPAWIAERFAD